MTGMIKGSLPSGIALPKIPFDFSFSLPFDLPNPANILGDSEIPKKEKVMEDLANFAGKDKKIAFDSLEIEKRITVEKQKKDTIYVITQTSGGAIDSGTTAAAVTTAASADPVSSYYRLVYKKHLIGGWKLEEVKPYNVAGAKTSIAGVSNKNVTTDQNLFADIPTDWKYSNVKVVEHYTDMKAGTDTVVVYMELLNDYVYMTGTKEMTYKYNGTTGKWESTGPASKMTCLSIKPVEQPESTTTTTTPAAAQT